MSAEPIFMLSDSLRQGALRAVGANDAAVGTAATVMVERLMKESSFVEAARIALLGRRYRSASQALRCAVARGGLSFTDLFSDALEGVSYRDAVSDPFLGVAVAFSAHGRLIDSARDELLALGVKDAARIGEHDETELASAVSTAAEGGFERRLWASTIVLIAQRALGDWAGLADAAHLAIGIVAATPGSVLAGVGALRSFLTAQIEVALALVGEPEYRTADVHRRLATALRPADREWVLGSVALAAAIRGEVAEAHAVLREIERTVGDDGTLLVPEHAAAAALIALESRDGASLERALDQLARANLADSGLHDLRTVIEARKTFLRDQGDEPFDAMRGVAKHDGLPWAHAEAVAFRIEKYLAAGLFSQAQAAIDEVMRTPYARWHLIRLALAKSRFAQGQVEAGLKIAESVWVAEGTTPRNHARALAIGAACARQLGDTTQATRLQHDMRVFCLRSGMQEPYDDLPRDTGDHTVTAVPRIRPALPMPLERIELTKRELAVLRALNDLSSADDIAVALHVSKNTVKTQLRHIYRKLGVHSRVDALRAAIDEGVL